jgi:hypothetical protein
MTARIGTSPDSTDFASKQLTYRFQLKFVPDQAHTIKGQTLTGFAGFCRIEAGKNLTPPLKSSHKYQSSQRCKSGVGTLIQL